ncbi:putative ABC transport system ATP-binding protein [Ruminococcus sp. YE71]|uniref:ABC transporter ATP-binding protein n=1 Tax=unclassified Ruminococcus TaxID=2608920 RepID=UPI00088FB2E2|nr:MULTISPECIES: ABC transporter ATP-binding protein [unclassified Ruminococcus]SDA31497.1 putative ABC transport system ATP-binding protein [Ruminococcus sp. YE78]SFW51782.1 putative ABC transport system ATP-binding protein [Ruminococcus sp. YE71]
MIELKNVSKKFETKTIFSDVSFVINDGEFVVISGKSGCGKSTLLSLISGIERVTTGSITVDGTDLTKTRNKTKFLREKISFLFQNFALSDNKTVMKNLKMIPKNARSSISIEQALDILGIADKADKPVYTLSGGEQQRVALARVMLKKCDIVLADEPTGSLDIENSEIVIEVLKKLNRAGKTIILVTHDESLKNTGDRLIQL